MPIPWLTTATSHFKRAVDKVDLNDSISYDRELLLAPNSSTVAIDWYEHPENIVKNYHGLLVIFTHGLNGRLESLAIKSCLRIAKNHRLSLCAVNIQGVNDVALSSSQTGLGLSFVIELKAAVERINQHLGATFPKAGFALGIGGAPVLEFLNQEKSGFTSLILVSCPLDLDRFCMTENEVMDALLDAGKSVLRRNSDALTKTSVEETSKALAASNLHEFFSNVACKGWGHPTLASLFKVVDPYLHLDTIQKPTLLIYSLDDESVDFTSCVDLIRLCRNPFIAVAVTEVGGHCGFQALNPDWLMESVCQFAASGFKPVI
jgi:predicted alpha/beta-fold hydrolase